MVPGMRVLDYEERLERLNLMTLEERRNRSDLIEMFKISRGLFAIPWNLFFRVDNSERRRGHSMKLMKESFRMVVRKYFFSQRVLNRWNRSNEDVSQVHYVHSFAFVGFFWGFVKLYIFGNYRV